MRFTLVGIMLSDSKIYYHIHYDVVVAALCALEQGFDCAWFMHVCSDSSCACMLVVYAVAFAMIVL